MENTYNRKFGLKIIALILVFFVAFMPFHNIKKVYANALEGSTASIIVALLLSGLVASGAISGGYQVSPTDLSSIAEKAQANLQAAGANAVEQANRLGEAIKSGAESAKIKALASGAVIYAFLQAIQETLFSKTEMKHSKIQEYINSGWTVYGEANGVAVVVAGGAKTKGVPIFAPLVIDGKKYAKVLNATGACEWGGFNYVEIVIKTGTVYSSAHNGVIYYSSAYGYYTRVTDAGAAIIFGTSNAYTPSASSIASA